ncbi:MAG: metallophosphoesterase, partial [Clostridia bacterium]|nr:metallophosphoesterase [Clostridia bacterium]
MNRRPQKSRSSYDAFTPAHMSRFRASSPDSTFFEKRRRRSPGMVILRAAALLLTATLIANFLSNFFVHVRSVDVPITGLTADFDGFTLLHLSDLKGVSFGSGQSRLISAIKDEKIDAILLTGDMVSPLGDAQPLYALLEAFADTLPGTPIYFIAGDADPQPLSMEHASGGSPFAPWVLGAQQRGAEFLSQPQRITRGNQTLWLTTTAQLTLDLDTMQRQYEQSYLRAQQSGDENEVEMTAYNLNTLEATRSARAAMAPEDVYITLAHVPPAASDLTATPDSLISRIDLALCGHYLGGLMHIPP